MLERCFDLMTKIEIGKTYGDIKVLEFSHKDKHKKRRYICKCLHCGSEFVTLGTLVKNFKIKSCGCLTKEIVGKINKKHGMAGTEIYKRWKGMKTRCNYKGYHARERYYDKGIKVCERWNNDFMNFYNDMYPTFFEGAELDRIDNSKGYYPENCRWVTHKENSNNRDKYKNNSGYTGIHLGKKNKTYQVNLSHKRKIIYIGSYKTLKEAVNARKEFIINFNSENNTNYKYEEYQG